MTFEEFRQPGAPVVICVFEKLPIGEIANDISGLGACNDMAVPHMVLREVTFEDYLATIRPEHRSFVRENAEPDALFYEVSVD
jgi:hypothetical protein